MEVRKTLRYTFSTLLILTTLISFAQKQEWHGITVGTDLTRFALPLIDSTRHGWEFSGDFEFFKDVFGFVEIGSQSTNFDTKYYTYNSSGAYTRIGADYNFMKHLDKTSNDKFFIGARYGFTTFYHNAQNITIENDIWGNFNQEKTENNWLGANWLEITTGMRAHLFNNFYMGWSARFKIKLWAGNDQQLASYHIPGYGRGYASSGFGINYSLYYKIPIVKKGLFHKKGIQTQEENKTP